MSHNVANGTDKSPSDRTGEQIAIIGSGCRYPGGVQTPSQLWELLEKPKDVSSALPPSRFNASGFYHKDSAHHGHTNVKDLRGYFLSTEGIERQFDANFFGINNAEANVLDPQVRLLLEVTYEALESAGIPFEALQGTSTGCYVGLMSGEYESAMLKDTETIGTYHATGTARSFMSNRLSYFFDWHGPSMTIDTACSSSLVAIHQAVQLLRSGQSRVAVAAGANMIMDPTNYISESKLQMLSPDGQSRMWDASANGYARGEGICTIVMKTLANALADGDHIECVIRETGCNSDGRTNGITRPSSVAQATLIRETYARAGLNTAVAGDRPQYFEAHGTGTGVGDPVEAEAIHSAFFGGSDVEDGHLKIGSIKTVCGHTEGTAGVAGILKASLALQNGVVPPNLLFESLNPNIRPFVDHLHLATNRSAWPPTKTGQPRRASVNSFGFGGTNAHAILESFDNFVEPTESGPPVPVFMPFVFSAATPTSLRRHVESFTSHLEANTGNMRLRDLSYTLHSRRSRFNNAVSISAADSSELLAKLNDILKTSEAEGKPIGVRTAAASRSLQDGSAVLGILTGQGAQWPTMGAELLMKSKTASDIIARLEERLSRLPTFHRPDWSLREELLRSEDSRVGEARFSQPLCTAVQILLTDIACSAGLDVGAIVGHSSGEIAAAYLAGVISAEDAICIAYYRGLFTKLAGSSSGQPGSMLAVGTSAEDAEEVLESGQFNGRARIAAVNSSSSVTLSGDHDAIEELREIFEDEDKFVRVLKVEKAYHSHHMAPAADSLRQSLVDLDIKINSESLNKRVWVSSVTGQRLTSQDSDRLKADYWVDNLLSPVLFMQAIKEACKIVGTPSAVLEIGPHPALRSPSEQTLREECTRGDKIPYSALLKRSSQAIASVADGLGNLSLHLPSTSLDLQAYDRFISAGAPLRFHRGVPGYVWDHDTDYWHDSRATRAHLHRAAEHELLGHLHEKADAVRQWRQILSPKEISWLTGHRLQDQIVFPAAGYVSLAIEAAGEYVRSLGEPASVALIEVRGIDISQAMTFNSDDAKFEALFRLYNIVRLDDHITADFRYVGAAVTATPSPGHVDPPLRTLATGSVFVTLGAISTTSLPPRGPAADNTLPVRTEDWYKSLQHMGYQYTGPFYALENLQRKQGAVRGQVKCPDDPESTLLIHPAMLDAAFQSVLLAQAAPYDGTLWSLHVPRTIKRVTVNPALLRSELIRGKLLELDASQPVQNDKFQGDVDVYLPSGGKQHALCQVEGLDCIPFAPASAKDDKQIFAVIEWGPAYPDAATVSQDLSPSEEEVQLGQLLERLSQFYMQNMSRAIPEGDPTRKDSPIAGIFGFAAHIDSLIRSGDRKFWDLQWNEDTFETIEKAMEPFKDNVDIRLIKRIGENLIRIANGEVSAIEIAMEDHLLNEVYVASLGLKEVTGFVAKVVHQITHRYPHMNVLEVGGGTAGCTKAIFNLTDSFASYTFSDISSAFFPTAQQVFEGQALKMKYQVFDVGKDPIEQGLQPQTYDLIVASMVLHVTRDLSKTMKNIRRLLKPGGYLIIQEGFNNDVGRSGAIFGAFPDWWLGIDDGRVLGPLMSIAEWDDTLRKSGFSGIDTCSSTSHQFSHPTAVFVSQAIDNRVASIRDPLSTPLAQPAQTTSDELVIVGGNTQQTTDLIASLVPILGKHYQRVTRFGSFSELANADLDIASLTSVLTLSELDEPLLHPVDDSKFEAIKSVLLNLDSILWITQGRRASNPFANMTVGMMRGVVCEVPTLTSQFLDFEKPDMLSAQAIATAMLRFKAQLAISKHREDGDPLLGSLEREFVLDARGQMLIPRLVPAKDMNDRYNSSRRPVFRSMPLDPAASTAINLKFQPNISKYCFQEEQVVAGESAWAVPIISLLSAVQLANDSSYVHLSLAKTVQTGPLYVVVSSQLGPRVQMLQSTVIQKEIAARSRSAFMVLLAEALICVQILHSIPSGGHLVAFRPDLHLATTLQELAIRQKIRVTVIDTALTEDSREGSRIRIHPQAPTRRLNALLPSDMAVFLNCERDANPTSVAARIASLRPHSCQFKSLSDYYCPTSSCNDHKGEVCSSQDLLVAVNFALQYCNTSDPSRHISTVLASDLASGKESDNTDARTTAVEWNTVGEVPVKVRRIDDSVGFSHDKTYWLAGLSGGLGLSLCEWMIARGAKHIVITSRSPKVGQSWLRSMSALGAEVAVFACDLTSREQTTAIYNKITSSMPPLGGVAQGAMVLQDTGFRDMSSAAMAKVLGPKVAGSINLNGVVRDLDLEFFVFFSSATAIIGNAGQSNYSAANMFMTSLAKQRRQRGQAASVIHIGPILGVGYVTQQGDAVRDLFARQGEYTFMSEADFHQLFAEAVAAGRPAVQRRQPLEICMGISKLSEKPTKELAWYLNPLSAHMTGNVTAEIISNTSKSRSSVTATLEKATTAEQVFAALRDAFLPALCALFQLNSTLAGDAHFLDERLERFGLDSLLAVEIRMWWLTTLQVSIPVMKILSGVTVRDIIKFGADGLLPDQVPNLTDQENATESGKVVEEEADDQALQNGHQTDGRKYVSPQRPLPPVIRSMEMSFNQQMYWFGLTSTQEKSVLNHTACYRIVGQLNLDDFERAVLHLGQIHDTLRTCFRTAQGHTSMGIIESCTLRVHHQNITSEAEVDAFVRKVQATAYDLERAETMRIVVLSLSPIEHYLVSGSHSLVMDGLSSVIFLRELARLYQNFSSLTESEIYQHSDWVSSQRESFQSGALNESINFWKACWASPPPPLPTLRISQSTSRSWLGGYDNVRAEAVISPVVKSRIWSVCRRNNARPFHFFLATFRALLARLTDAQEFAIAISDANRPQQDSVRALGAFANIVLVRCCNDPSERFSEVLRDSVEKTSVALQHSDVPFNLLLSELGETRSTTHTPMAQAFFDYRQGMRKKQPLGDCELEMVSFQASQIPYDITLDIIDDASEGDCTLHLIVRNDLYTDKQATMLVKCMVKLAESFSRIANMSLDSAAMFDAQELERVREFSIGPLPMSESETILDMINRHVDTTPHADALKTAGTRESAMSYASMMRRADTIASALIADGCVKGSIVATFQERTPEWMCGVLGILRAGAICLPLDIGLPLARLATILKHAVPQFFIREEDEKLDQSLLEICNTSGARVVTTAQLICPGHRREIAETRASDTAMIFYTSGSTGTPKGIVIHHQGLVNWVEAAMQLFGTGRGEIFLQQTSCSFDMCFVQAFLGLCSGGLLCMVPTRYRADATFLTNVIADERISWTGATPSEYANWHHYGNREALSRALPHWRTAMAGGEPTTHGTLELFASLDKSSGPGRRPRFFNVYGPTETTVGAVGTELAYLGDFKSTRITVGKPLTGYLVYVLDDKLQPVPVGVQGEIVIGGAGVSTGYLHDLELSSQRFRSNPLVPEAYRSRGWTTMHCTGDIGRWLEDGTLLIEGRKDGDTQVKLRGLRIDLAEVEHCIFQESQGTLVQVIVTPRHIGQPSGQQDNRVLVAHAKFTTGAFPTHDEQQAFLNKLIARLPLPQYMRPAAGYPVEELPMLISGKLDRKAVAELPLDQERAADDDQPTITTHSMHFTETESRVKSLWETCISSEISKQYNIEPGTDFFHIGGNSTLLLKLQYGIQKEFGISLSLIDMFEHTTLSAMARRIDPDCCSSSDSGHDMDWSAETDVPQSLMKALLLATPRKAAPPRVVVMTGASGFMGQAFLQALLSEPTIRKVHCIAVRLESPRTTQVLLQPNSPLRHPKVELHSGDLAEPNLGLDDTTVSRIFGTADCIIHNGADTSHMKSYQSLQRTNVASTREIVKMCLSDSVRCMVPIHFVSSGEIWSSSGLAVAEETSAVMFPPLPGLSTGYGASKWASEIFLEKVFQHSHSRWQMCIHRPASVQPDGMETASDAADSTSVSDMDLTQTLLHYCRLTGSVPLSPRFRGFLNLVSLSSVVRDMLRAVRLGPSEPGKIDYLHEIGELDIPLDQLRSVVQGAIEVDVMEWATRAAAAGADPVLVSMFQKMAGEHEVSFPQLRRSRCAMGSRTDNGRL